jgi:hypothetical protein
MAREERLAVLEDPVAVVLEEAGPLEQSPAARAPDRVADVVADDRGQCGEREDELDPHVAVAGQHACGDERGLTRDGRRAGLRDDQHEQRDVRRAGADLQEGKHRLTRASHESTGARRAGGG